MKRAILTLTVLFNLVSHADGTQGCKIDGRCNNENFPYRVVYEASGENATGFCSATFENALDMFMTLEETGQCSPTKKTQTCVVEGKCNNENYPFRVVYQSTGENVTGFCDTELEGAAKILAGLKYTGQCANPVPKRRCGIDGKCSNSQFPYRVFYMDDNTNVVDRCYSSFEDARIAFRALRDVGQCGIATN